jgi:adenosine deaminase
MAVPDTIRALPRAELHLHIEGSLEPEMMLALATRNGIASPYSSIDEARAAYDFDSLQDFLDLYYRGMSVLQRMDDFHDLTAAYLARAAADGVTRAEIFFDPQGHTARGIPLPVVIDGITTAMMLAERTLGISTGLILCFLRHLSEDDALETLENALPYKDRIVGVGLDSSEMGHPPSKFKRVFDRARDQGFHLMAHAGEEGPPEYIWEAIDDLGVERIDHGNRALEDEALVRRIATDGLALTVCPLSNLSLGVVDDLAAHPLKRMLDAGLKATINSDDPAYFGGYLVDNINRVAAALDLGDVDLVRLLRNSLEASFAPEIWKTEALADFDRKAARAIRQPAVS